MKASIFRSKSSGGGFFYQLIVRFLIPAALVLWIVFLVAPMVTADAKPMLRGGGKGSDSIISIDSNPRVGAQVTSREQGGSGTKITHAIIVAGHAVMKMSKLSVADRNEDAWYLLPYQLNQGLPSLITSHIKKGVDFMKKDPSSLLIFSGGQTRHDVGPVSEAASYYFLAQDKGWLSPEYIERVYLDEYARDSFENLLFSICRFREIQGYYPTKVSVIGFDFKAERFTTLHRQAIKFPANSFSYIGIKPATLLFDYERAVAGEKAALQSFQTDMYGCNDPSLKQKRDSRNPFRRTIPYELGCPELKYLLSWCGPDRYDEKLPWEKGFEMVA